MGDVVHRLGGEVGENLRVDLDKAFPERYVAGDSLGAELPVAGVVLAEGQEVCVAEFGHGGRPSKSSRSVMGSATSLGRARAAPHGRSGPARAGAVRPT